MRRWQWISLGSVALFAIVGGLMLRRAKQTPVLTNPDAPRELVTAALDTPKRAGSSSQLELGGKVPNVVLITMESVGENRMGFLGNPRGATPALDRLAEDSLVFERAYATATHSNYAQMAIVSSLFPRRGRTLDMYGRIDYPRLHLHDRMHQLGHRTASISSQDESWQGMLRYQQTDTPTFYWNSNDYEGPRLNLISEEVVPDHVTIDRAIRFIDEQAGGRFSLYINLQATHFPFPTPDTAPKPFEPLPIQHRFDFLHWDERDSEAIQNQADNALAYVDANIGRFAGALEERGLLQETLLVVTADHGELFFEHDLVTHGRSLFDGEARVPLMFHLPAEVPARRVREAVSTLDVVPTILDLLGLPPEPVHQGESVRFLGLVGEQRLTGVFLNIQGWKHLSAVVCMPHKLIYDPETQRATLYDLEADPGEVRDLAGEQPERAADLRALLLAQLEAQERYHQDSESGRELRATRFAPHMLACPHQTRGNP